MSKIKIRIACNGGAETERENSLAQPYVRYRPDGGNLGLVRLKLASSIQKAGYMVFKKKVTCSPPPYFSATETLLTQTKYWKVGSYESGR